MKCGLRSPTPIGGGLVRDETYCTCTTTPAVSGHHQTGRGRSVAWSAVTTRVADMSKRPVSSHRGLGAYVDFWRLNNFPIFSPSFLANGTKWQKRGGKRLRSPKIRRK